MAPAIIERKRSMSANIAPPSDEYRPFVGKVALITGSSRGIGRGIAIELARRGADIVVNYASSSKAADKVVGEIRSMGVNAIALRADITDPAQVVKLFDAAVEELGGVDFVVSNSGRECWSDELDVTKELFDEIFDLNCRGQFFVAQQGLKHCRRGGRIILTSSIAASLPGIRNHALYAGSKAAVEGLTRAFAADAGKKQITVNAIAPGGILTDMFDVHAWNYVPGGTPDTPIEKIKNGLRQMVPLDRIGTPADIGKAVSLLCHPDGEWINGQVITLTGGANA